MSECAGVLITNLPGAARFGTVGKPVPGVEVTLAGDGELLRGPMVMRGYRHDPAATATAIDDAGWLHTGDLATIDGDGYVTITGRKKELIITAAGKNISPANIENAVLAASLLIAHAVAIGDRRPQHDRPQIPPICAAWAGSNDTAHSVQNGGSARGGRGLRS